MFKFKRFFISCILAIFVIFSNNLHIYASVEVTDESLNKALQNYVSSGINENRHKITMSNGKIIIEQDGKNYTVNYELNEKPKFTFSIPIYQGMSYEEYEEEINNVYFVLIGYIAIANVQGVSIEEASKYCDLCLLDDAFSSNTDISSKYTIATDGMKVESDGTEIIYESDFGNHVMEYVNSVFTTKQMYSDSKLGINTFTWTKEQKDVTETSCNLVSTLTVNLNEDFSKINELMESIDFFKDITERKADYVLKLKVGQQCRIQSNEKSTGYANSNKDCIKIDDNQNIITAIKEGTAKVYLYFNSNGMVTSSESDEDDKIKNENIDMERFY